MSEKILVPVLGESITEATVSKWLKNEGDTVEADEPIVELETDKVNLEVPSPISGTLAKINSEQAFAKLTSKGLILRNMDQYKIPNSLRLTIGNEKENEYFIKAIKEILK